MARICMTASPGSKRWFVDPGRWTFLKMKCANMELAILPQKSDPHLNLAFVRIEIIPAAVIVDTDGWSESSYC
ncbi:hypothetical protein TNCV_3978511 [Trichonephila clavipes]|uniref:Uncharacterized protein n=1 Tax=Trichonephila clavipes TaxID=2585209 RepID=A0A8X6WIA1_TRICX|nr:hypothetical protein TNCV_3978511 [Trichonephila clavipes]